MGSPLLLSYRAAARMLGVGRGDSLKALIATGLLRPVSMLGKWKIPLEQVQQLARAGDAPPVVRPAKRTSRTGAAIADIDLESL